MKSMGRIGVATDLSSTPKSTTTEEEAEAVEAFSATEAVNVKRPEVAMHTLRCLKSIIQISHHVVKDILTMAEVLGRLDVDAGFITHSHSSGMATLGLRMCEEAENVDCNLNLLQYPSIPLLASYQAGCSEKLDQIFDIPAGLKLALLDFDFCLTKKLSKLRAMLAKDLKIDIDPDKTFKNPSNE